MSLKLDQKVVELIESQIQDSFLEHTSSPGLAVAIVRDQKVLSAGYGNQNIETKRPTTADTLYSIGSLTKSITSVLVVKILHEKYPELGEDVLDTPIRELLKEDVHFSDLQRSRTMTFRDILSHRSGLMDESFDLIFGGGTKADLLNRVRYEPEAYPHRQGFLYNHSLYVLAGELIAQITGGKLTVEELLLDLMREIGMKTGTIIDAKGEFANSKEMSQGYYMSNGTMVPYNQTFVGFARAGVAACGILASANDMLAYMQFLLNEGLVGTQQIIPKEVMGWLYKISSIGVASSGKKYKAPEGENTCYGYSLGIRLHRVNNMTVYCHLGWWGPFTTAMSIVAEKGIGIFSATNSVTTIIREGVKANQQGLHLNILQILQGLNVHKDMGILTSIHPRLCKVANVDVVKWAFQDTALDLPNFAGTYSHPGRGYVKLTDDLEICIGELWGGLTESALHGVKTFRIHWHQVAPENSPDLTPIHVTLCKDKAGTHLLLHFVAGSIVDTYEFRKDFKPDRSGITGNLSSEFRLEARGKVHKRHPLFLINQMASWNPKLRD